MWLNRIYRYIYLFIHMTEYCVYISKSSWFRRGTFILHAGGSRVHLQVCFTLVFSSALLFFSHFISLSLLYIVIVYVWTEWFVVLVFRSSNSIDQAYKRHNTIIFHGQTDKKERGYSLAMAQLVHTLLDILHVTPQYNQSINGYIIYFINYI